MPAWKTAAAHGEVLCEKFVAGIEVTVGILGDNPPRALPTLEIVSERPLYDYAAKYTAGQSHHVIPARLPEEGVAPVRTPRSGRIAPSVAATSRAWTSSWMAAACPGCSR